MAVAPKVVYQQKTRMYRTSASGFDIEPVFVIDYTDKYFRAYALNATKVMRDRRYSKNCNYHATKTEAINWLYALCQNRLEILSDSLADERILFKRLTIMKQDHNGRF